ncbi:ABC transporter ATP-binding protein, partial [Enterococcus faecalis]
GARAAGRGRRRGVRARGQAGAGGGARRAARERGHAPGAGRARVRGLLRAALGVLHGGRGAGPRRRLRPDGGVARAGPVCARAGARVPRVAARARARARRERARGGA